MDNVLVTVMMLVVTVVSSYIDRNNVPKLADRMVDMALTKHVSCNVVEIDMMMEFFDNSNNINVDFLRQSQTDGNHAGKEKGRKNK
uniref:Uncharacterized protein n=1 Tax=Onchocerca volvulus TaxID=6282 RepID=A0A8R1TKJ4_ONCVO